MSEPMHKSTAHFTVESTEVGNLYYFAPADRAPGPYLTQIHVNAIVDIAADGTLAGVELIDEMPPPPLAKLPPVAIDEVLQGLVSDLKEGCCVKPSLTGDGWHIDIPGTDVMCRMAAEALESAVRDRDHWKANHDQMVQRNAVLRERPDLPVDRLPAIARYEEQIAALIAERANIISTKQDQLARLTAERDAAIAKWEKADGMDGAVVDAIRQVLYANDVPKAAFIDDHVGNAIIMRNVATDRADALTERVRWAHDTLYEINVSNYDHDEVCKLNDASVEVILGLAPLLGEKHGKSDEWWADRAKAVGNV